MKPGGYTWQVALPVQPRFILGLASPFFPETQTKRLRFLGKKTTAEQKWILLSRKPPQTQGKRLRFWKEGWLHPRRIPPATFVAGSPGGRRRPPRACRTCPRPRSHPEIEGADPCKAGEKKQPGVVFPVFLAGGGSKPMGSHFRGRRRSKCGKQRVILFSPGARHLLVVVSFQGIPNTVHSTICTR